MFAPAIPLVLVIDAIDTLAWPRSSGAGATGGVVAVGAVTAAPGVFTAGASSAGDEPLAEVAGETALPPARGGVAVACAVRRDLSRVSRAGAALLRRAGLPS